MYRSGALYVSYFLEMPGLGPAETRLVRLDGRMSYNRVHGCTGRARLLECSGRRCS